MSELAMRALTSTPDLVESSIRQILYQLSDLLCHSEVVLISLRDFIPYGKGESQSILGALARTASKGLTYGR